jgi:bifunctional DNase/RNase
MLENEELIAIKFSKVMQSKTYTCIVLGTDTKKFAIYTDPASGKGMQMFLTETDKPRPSTHDLISMMFRGLDIKILQVVISELHETIYSARLFLEQKNGDQINIVEIDARPSDCITLALMHKVPVFCTKTVLDKVVPVVEE